jgi:putative SOS response-associated peptidase YedK
MCGRIQLSMLDHFFIRYSIKHPVFKIEPHYNIAPGMRVPVVIRRSPNRAVLMRWGLVPFWARDPRIGYHNINARAETVELKPSFRKPFRTQRCLVPVNSFYEWRRAGGEKIPYSFSLINEETFSLAGLYDVWRDAEGRGLETFTIITCAANELMAPIHDRMPVILKRVDEHRWIDPEQRDVIALKELLRPYPSNLMRKQRISTLVNKPENDREEILRPVPEDHPPVRY